MTDIQVDKYCCGNCELYKYFQCTNLIINPSYSKDIHPSPSHPACNEIHKNYIDREYKLKLAIYQEKK